MKVIGPGRASRISTLGGSPPYLDLSMNLVLMTVLAVLAAGEPGGLRLDGPYRYGGCGLPDGMPAIVSVDLLPLGFDIRLDGERIGQGEGALIPLTLAEGYDYRTLRRILKELRAELYTYETLELRVSPSIPYAQAVHTLDALEGAVGSRIQEAPIFPDIALSSL